jgi:hypothetical protein
MEQKGQNDIQALKDMHALLKQMENNARDTGVALNAPSVPQRVNFQFS